MKVNSLRGGDSMLSIWEDPREETYSLLIDYSMEKCDYFTLKVSEQLDLHIEGKEVLDQLQSSLIKSEREEFGLDEKQVTTTYYYRCGKDSALVLKNSANTLFSWVQPRLPEDLCFYTNMDNCWLLTVTHERIGEFNVSDEETQAIMRSIKNLSLIGEFNNTTEALIRDSKRWQTESLNITDNDLAYLPEAFGELINLKSLRITGDRFKELPNCIGNLTNLEEISILSYDFYKLPQQIGELNKLKKLMIWGSYCSAEELAENNFEITPRRCPLKTLPNEIGNLKKMEFLEISSTSLEEVPHEIGLLKCLRWLQIDYAKLKVIPNEINNLEKLELLCIGDNQIEFLPEEIGFLTNLSGLTIKNNKIKSFPSSISNLRNLKYIDIENNPIVDDEYEINKLENIPAFETIYI